jgi:hypothetical protein
MQTICILKQGIMWCMHTQVHRHTVHIHTHIHARMFLSFVNSKEWCHVISVTSITAFISMTLKFSMHGLTFPFSPLK